MRVLEAGIVAVTPGDHDAGRDLGPWLVALGEAGLRTVVLREPHLQGEAYRALVEVAHRSVPRVILHARTRGARDLAARLGLGLHFTSHGEPQDARAEVPGAIGVSCHTHEEVDRAFAAGADYAFYGPVWTPTSKALDRRVTTGEEDFLAVAGGRPVYALGGVTPERWALLRERGARGAAVCGDLFGRDTPRAAAARLRKFLSAQKAKRSSS